ncbi:MAG: hypothetical protein JWP74_921 [Marmoricola sp.]|nr:hypothetical protein [Marmoricola sp.]
MTTAGTPAQGASHHRWLLGLEPFFEGGWRHRGDRGHRWAVEDRLTAVALLGDVTIELDHTRRLPDSVSISAWSIFRDVDVVVPSGRRVELVQRRFFGAPRRSDLAAAEAADRLVSIQGHSFLGDVNVLVLDAEEEPWTR